MSAGRTLDAILDGVRADLTVRQLRVPLGDLKSLAAVGSPPIDAVAALRRPGGVQVIAEVKRASPAAGPLAEITDPGLLAAEYAAGGAAVVSVLTEERRFRGSLADLDAVRARVTVPVLRKDFVVSPYQLWETRAHQADLALLVVAALSQPDLVMLVRLAEDIGLTPLVEVHSEDEVSRAVAAGARLIVVGARDPHTLEVDHRTFAKLAGAIPDDVVRIAQSGIRVPQDVASYAADGADAVLLGEALVTSPTPRHTLTTLLSAGRRPR
ncbi:indole-3-glycerol phosphate synthase TrpC [Streptomyces subrutilus]|nr:indole-3-glycerol phosphate synthase TrpC [Streptomyces subrutilus]QEU82935.1 indole-3-glycerol phosphate synthase TrpC [Streptomyces subrutilus]WSJ31172.1 indole-3-glycerol phosphate synthase TrpC [Streptomyces subrutilus]